MFLYFSFIFLMLLINIALKLLQIARKSVSPITAYIKEPKSNKQTLLHAFSTISLRPAIGYNVTGETKL